MGIMLRETCYTEKDKYCMVSYTHTHTHMEYEKKNQTHRNRVKIDCQELGHERNREVGKRVQAFSYTVNKV